MAEFFAFTGGVRPFSEAVKVGDLLFISGQVGVDRSNGIFSSGIEGQTEQAIKNLCMVLGKHGLTFADVVKMTAILTDKKQIAGFNQVYAKYFPQNPPARTLMVIQDLVGDAIMELDAIAEIKQK